MHHWQARRAQQGARFCAPPPLGSQMGTQIDAWWPMALAVRGVVVTHQAGRLLIFLATRPAVAVAVAVVLAGAAPAAQGVLAGPAPALEAASAAAREGVPGMWAYSRLSWWSGSPERERERRITSAAASSSRARTATEMVAPMYLQGSRACAEAGWLVGG